MNNVLVTVRKNSWEPYDRLYVSDTYWTEDDDLSPSSFIIDMPITETDDITIKLEDGAAFRISKKQSLNDVTHKYWSITMVVPPLVRCELSFAGKGYSDSLRSYSHVRHVWINGKDAVPIEK